MRRAWSELWTIVGGICALVGLIGGIYFGAPVSAESKTENLCSIVGPTDNSGTLVVNCIDEVSDGGSSHADQDGASGSNPQGSYQVELDKFGGCVGKADENGTEIKCER